MKIFDIVKDANQNLLRNKLRSFLTILAIFIGSFTIILSTAINAGVNDFIDKQVEGVGGEGYLEMMPKEFSDSIQELIGGGGLIEYKEKDGEVEQDIPPITDEKLEEIRKIDGVKSVDAFTSSSIEYIKFENQDKKYSVFSLNVMPRGNLNIDLLAGRAPSNDTDNYEIIIPQEYLETFGYNEDETDKIIGKHFTIAAPKRVACMMTTKRSDCLEKIEVEIVGVQAKGVMSMGGARINLPAHEKIVGINYTDVPGGAKAYQATADVDPEKVEEIKEKLDEIGFTAMTIDDEVGQIRTFFDAILIVFAIFGGIALLAAAIGIINTLFMSVQERTREIGLDKALGMSNARIFFSFTIEAIMLGFWGSIFGTVVSMIIGTILNNVAHTSFLKDLPTFTLLIFTPENILIITGIIMFIAFLAGTLPARKASKKNPIDALRYE